MANRIVIDRDVMVPMRDGVTLATDVYQPVGEGPFPALVHRMPYDKSNSMNIGSQMINPVVAAEHGYAVVVQDCRGCFASGGVINPYHDEGPDGYDTVEWAASQPWCTGDVGIYGSSYMGVTTMQATIAAPPHLKAAMSYITSAGSFYQGWMYSGGALELGFNLGYTAGMVGRSIPRIGLTAERQSELRKQLATTMEDRNAFERFLPLSEAPVVSEPDVPPYWREYLEHSSYDDYWRRLDVVARAEEIRVPIFHIGAWYDQFLKGHLDLQRALQAHPDELVHDHSRVIFGPWEHETYMGYKTSTAGERNFGSTALSGVAVVADLVIGWFDHWLKGDETQLMSQPRVRWFQMGGTKGWRTSDSWPPASTATNLHLHSNGAANTRHGDGGLSLDPPGAQPADTYSYDPADPVPTVGGRAFGGGVRDRAQVEERSDVLVYTSTELADPIIIAGNVSVDLWVASSAPDTDFTAHLVDVEPDGYCAVIADGVLRARFRDSFEEPQFLTPGEPTRVTIDLWDVAHCFDVGHAVRLELSSSSFPRWSRNANSEKSPETAGPEDLRVAEQQILHDADHPSSLVLPVLAQ